MKRELIAASVGGCGVSVAIFVAWHMWKKQVEENEQHAEEESKATPGIRKKVTFDEKKTENPPSLSKLRGILLSQGDNAGITAEEKEDDILDGVDPHEPLSSGSSYTSCEENLSHPSPSESNSSSLTSDENSSIDGAVGPATYERYEGLSLSDTEFQDLLASPVVSEIPEDLRMERSSIQGRSLFDVQATVQQYDPELSPSRVDEQCWSRCDIYGSINMPLCPNTGNILPDSNVTTRSHRKPE